MDRDVRGNNTYDVALEHPRDGNTGDEHHGDTTDDFYRDLGNVYSNERRREEGPHDDRGDDRPDVWVDYPNDHDVRADYPNDAIYENIDHAMNAPPRDPSTMGNVVNNEGTTAFTRAYTTDHLRTTTATYGLYY